MNKTRHFGEHSFPESVCEAAAVHDALRRLGFARDDILVGTAKVELPSGETVDRSLFVQLQTQGQKFTMNIAPWPDDTDLAQEWAKIAKWVRTAPEEDLTRLWTTSTIGGNVAALMRLADGIRSRGIIIPALAS
jgi:hypothetical protein